ncbi:three-Cys-motif partner protein TcmP [Halomarina pelagica]|uniref:three-Cys-motif partner protein TcmP n=1 Tax=Halomarina pelagica TaxID=2961599 RepID=UPI0020C2DFFC|nr:three-Cys-motif partner protein TcmP [Halomarina sp. BND7]
MRQPDQAWIRNQLRQLTDHSDTLCEIGDEEVVDATFGPWTALKLVSLTATVDVYTSIMANNGFNYYYVDAMSGGGIVNLDGCDGALVGSPIIAGTVPREPFEKLYFVEASRDRAEALRARLDYAVDEIDAFNHTRDDCVVIHGDANEVLPKLPQMIKEDNGGTLTGRNGMGGAHHLAFIDNEKYEVKFEAIRKLSTMLNDLLINYQETSLNRQYGRILRGDCEWDDFLAFFDKRGGVKRLEAPEDRFDFYTRLLENIDRSEYRSLQVRGSNAYSYAYRMVYATRLTGGGSEYAQFMDGQKRKIEGITGDEIGTVLDTMRGAGTTLDLWSAEEKAEDGQSKLADY